MRLGAGARRLALRAGQSIGTVGFIVVLVFLLARLIPGDPVEVILGIEYTPETAADLRQELNLDKAPLEQFTSYIGGLFQGDLGTSLAQRGRSVSAVIGEAMPTTLAVVLAAIIVAVLLGTVLGLVAATSRRKGVDVAVRTWVMLSYAVPTFLIGLLLILVFAIRLDWLPAGGWASKYPQNFTFLILPGLALSAHLAPVIARAVRQSAIDVSGQQYIEAAMARGLPRHVLNFRHILPNSVMPVITLVGISFGSLLTGAIIIEAVFGLPGLGAEMIKGVINRDYPVIQGIALITAIGVVLSSFLAELAYTLVDPRARRS
jgi:peptide/nickel transport system permease protein